MSGNSARRLGVTVDDADLEARLRRIENVLENKQNANIQIESNEQRRNRTGIPRVTGLEADDSIVGAFGVKWDPVDANISRYEVQLATMPGFANPSSFKVTEPNFVLPTTLDPTLTYYVRVRAVGTRVTKSGSRDIGDWSVTFSIDPGQATFNNLQTGAAGNVILYMFSDVAVEVLDLTGIAGTTSLKTILDVPQFDLPTAATCLVIISYQYLWENLKRLDSIRITVFLDAEEIGQFNKLIGETSIGRFDDWQDTIAMIPPPQALIAGAHKIKLVIELFTEDTPAGNPRSIFTTEKIVISVLEVRR